MSHSDIIRAWKDEDFRNSLSESERAQLPENPAGLIELTDADMEVYTGGLAGSTKTKCSGNGGCGCQCVPRLETA